MHYFKKGYKVEIINNSILEDWFSTEFITRNGKSVYGDVPESFKHFNMENMKNNSILEVLDLGYGDGRLSKYLINDNINVTGVDLTIKEDKTIDKITLFKKDIREFCFREKQYDLIISNEALNYINNQQYKDILRKIEMAVKPSGFIYLNILCDFNRIYLNSNTQFRFAEQIEMTVNECRNECLKVFQGWDIIDSSISKKKGQRPINKNNNKIKPYKWSANNLLLIAKK